MNRLLICLTLAIGLFSCGENAKPPVQPASDKDPDSAGTHLPVTDLLLDDMRKVDSYAGGIIRKVTTRGKQDSAFTNLDEFRQRAQQFLLKELDSASFQNNFQETSLMDESSRMLNFIYTPKNPGSTLRQVVVYVTPTLADDTIDRIYMETASKQGDTVIEKKLNWKMRKYFYVLTIKKPPTGDPLTSIEKLIWDPQHFGDQ